MRADPVAAKRDARPPAQPSGRFAAALERVRSRPAVRPGRNPPAQRAANGGVPMLALRRDFAQAQLAGLSRRRREFDVADRADAQLWIAAAPAAISAHSDAPEPICAATLAGAVERIAVEIRRREAAEGPSLELAFGGALRIRLTRGGRGLELAVSGAPAVSRLAAAELPGIVEALRRRGIAVARAVVSGRAIAAGPPTEGRAASARRVDAGGRLR